MKTYRGIFFLLAVLLAGERAGAQSDSIKSRIILVGDAGELTKGKHPVMEAVSKLNQGGKGVPVDRTTLFFLGDNIYPVGLPDPGTSNYQKKYDLLQLQWQKGKLAAGNLVFIPGNHDWAKGRPSGWRQVTRQAIVVNSNPDSSIRFLPEYGCPGPEEVALSSDVTAVIVDSQWWLQQDGRPGESSDCDCKSEEELLLRLKDIVYRNRNKLLLFITHHPFLSEGIHGGYFTFKQHIFPLTDVKPGLFVPLPVIGSLYPIVRGGFGNIQDLKHPRYKSLINGIDSILDDHPYCIRIAGHEHGLQHLEKNGHHYIVSGSGAKVTRLHNGPYTKFQQESLGYATLDVLVNGSVELKYLGVNSDNGNKELYSTVLPRFQPVADAGAVEKRPDFPDSVTAIAASRYKAGSFKKWLLGSNYRPEWTTPVRVPVLDITNYLGGLTPTRRGGGLQSRSLRFEDKSGKEYVIRSIEKFPDKTLPEELRETFVKDAVVDGISASYPYAALSVPAMADAAGVPHMTPRLVFLPDDPALAQYRTDFANALYLFEPRDPDSVAKSTSTIKLAENLQKDNDNQVDQKAVLRARLLDMFMMDFDRHEDQWRWGNISTKEGKSYYPIPRDRDQAFFMSEGVLPSVIRKPWILPKFQGFRPKAININTFNFNARYFDRMFLTEPDEDDWKKAIAVFVPTMTDSVIATALNQQPSAIRNQHAVSIVETLKKRRETLPDEALQYYRFLSKTVDIPGSDKREWFDLEWRDDGSLAVKVYKINRSGKRSDKLYDRIFDPSLTRELRLYGMNGDDVFNLHGNAKRSPLIRIIGGVGKDTLTADQKGVSAGKIKWYDLATEQNVKTGEGKFRKKFSDDPAVNSYERRIFKYNITAPLLSVAYNPDDGVFLGAGVVSTRHRFRKDPFHLRQQFTANYAIATGAYNFRYQLDVTELVPLPIGNLKNLDLRFIANLKAPNYTQNFFGFGNETEFPNEGDKKISYYRARFSLAEMGALVRARPLSNLSILTGPLFQHFWIDRDDEKNEEKFITDPASGINQETLYEPKTYFGWQLQAVVDNRNSVIMPSRGFYWNTFSRWVEGISDHAYAFKQAQTDLSFYTSFSARANVVVAVRVGGGVNSGSYEFFQAQYLGVSDNLRGFRKYRFAGKQMVFNNIDLRLKLGEIKGYILPATAGLVFFNDIGRVWIPGEKSGLWHDGFGGGIWMAPAGKYVFTACYSHSSDGGFPFISLGFQF
jgi:hypothetical protein